MSVITIPKYSQTEIHNKADQFRVQYCKEGLPVDVLDAVEFSLKWTVVPAKGLYLSIGVDSFINSKFTNIYVDSDRFIDDRYLDRMRFSIAHEIGHFVLHSGFYITQNIETVQDCMDFYSGLSVSDYDRLEKDAHEFAGRLLVPYDRLHASVKEAKEKVAHRPDLQKVQKSVLAKYMAPTISKEFQVCSKVVEIRISKERLL